VPAFVAWPAALRRSASPADPPPEKWSDLNYVF
jgi:hypothetical protein